MHSNLSFRGSSAGVLSLTLAAAIGCGGGNSYSRSPNTEPDGGGLGGAGGQDGPGTASGGMTASGGRGGEGGPGAVAGTGGMPPGSGGAGGMLAETGGTSAGGGAGVGGQTGGSGGAIATGGQGGRLAGSGGVSSGGAGGGSMGTGGAAATGGAGMGGSTTGGAGGNGVGGRGGGNAGSGGQRILSIDFVGGEASGGSGGLTGAIPMAASESAGVKAAKNWNSAAGPMGTLSSLVMADGSVATGATATWNAPTYSGAAGVWRIGYTDAPGDIRMMNGLLNPSWTAQTSGPVTVFTISNLPTTITTGGYDVYVYVLGGIPDSETQTRMYQYTIGNTTINVNQMGPTPTTVATPYPYVRALDQGSGNYIVFRQVTATSLTLTVRAGNSTGTFRAPINGIQLVWPTGS